jgi:hypothetical protein
MDGTAFYQLLRRADELKCLHMTIVGPALIRACEVSSIFIRLFGSKHSFSEKDDQTYIPNLII